MKESLLAIVEQGIQYEDDFIQIYSDTIRNEGLMKRFGAHAADAHTLLTTMIAESRGHREDLDALKEKMA